jgi:pimeloyl-ACP methyl ester carboxylesterase
MHTNHHPQSAIQFELKLQHITLSGLQWGPEGGKPIVALHGWLDNAASFNALAPLFNRLRPTHTIYALDFPGHGRSAHRPPSEIYHFVDFVFDLLVALRHLKIQRCTLLGHSMGAAVATLAAAAFPEYCDALVLLDLLGPISQPDLHTTLPDFKLHLSERLKYHLKPEKKMRLNQLIEARLPHSQITPEAAQAIVRRNTLPVDHESEMYQWCFDRRLKMPPPYRFSEIQVLEILRNISTPTLLFLAESTYQSHQALFDGRMAAHPALTTHQLKAGHYLHFSHASEIVQRIHQFLP